MSDQAQNGKAANAWLIIGAHQSVELSYPQFAVELGGERKLCADVTDANRIRYRLEA